MYYSYVLFFSFQNNLLSELQLKKMCFVFKILISSQGRQELERVKRRIETELNDVKEQLNEKKVQIDEMQQQLSKREDELNQALLRYIFLM